MTNALFRDDVCAVSFQIMELTRQQIDATAHLSALSEEHDVLLSQLNNAREEKAALTEQIISLEMVCN